VADGTGSAVGDEKVDVEIGAPVKAGLALAAVPVWTGAAQAAKRKNRLTNVKTREKFLGMI